MKRLLIAVLILTGNNHVTAKTATDSESPSPDNLAVYPVLPSDQYRSDVYEVTLSQAGHESRSSYVYKSIRDGFNPTNKTHTVVSTDANHWTSFSFRGAVSVQIKLRSEARISAASVHPLAKQIKASVANNAVTFTLNQPANLYVELADKSRDPLFIFANPPETNVPTRNTPKVIYFGPGVTDLGTNLIHAGPSETIYLAGGAYVKGRIKVAGQKAAPAVIRGRGILSGIDITENRGTFSQFMITGSHLNLEGIVVTDSPGPGCICGGVLRAENVKLFAWPMCSDGISGGAGSLVKNCFFKVNDDTIHFHVSGLKVIDNVVWLQQFGSALQMGWNERQSVDGELVDGLDIIGDDRGLGQTRGKAAWHNCNVVALIDIHNKATYKNITIQNVRHEGRPYQLFGVRTKLPPEDTYHASYREGRGGVDGMLFKHISSAKQPLHPSVFDGNGSDPGTIENVILNHLQIGGVVVTQSNAPAYIEQRGKTSGFQIISQDSQTALKQE